jgi:hypothetical protein
MRWARDEITRRNRIAAGWPTEAMLSMLTIILNQTTITLWKKRENTIFIFLINPHMVMYE